MKIGKLVKRHLASIFSYCETAHRSELARLCDAQWSKKAFDINYLFCLPVADIAPETTIRYWREEYSVDGVVLRVTKLFHQLL